MIFKQVTLCLLSIMRGFCPEMDCLEGTMYGGGFVQGGFVRKWLKCLEDVYVWRQLCMEGVLSEGVLSGGGFVHAPFYTRHITAVDFTHQ